MYRPAFQTIFLIANAPGFAYNCRNTVDIWEAPWKITTAVLTVSPYRICFWKSEDWLPVLLTLAYQDLSRLLSAVAGTKPKMLMES